ncbi:hypothetical protein RFI_26104, partial [Reticulomyxa filosa]
MLYYVFGIRIGSIRPDEKIKSNIVDLVKFGQWLEEKLFQDSTEALKKATKLWELVDLSKSNMLQMNDVKTLVEHCLCDYVESEHKIDARDMVVIDVERAIEQIIFHITPYVYEAHNITNSIDNATPSNSLQFSFQDFCKLGLWLQD